jgi:hypothetical protein
MGRRGSESRRGSTDKRRNSSSPPPADPKTVAFLEACSLGDLKAVKKQINDRRFGVDSDVDGVTGLMKVMTMHTLQFALAQH